MANRHGQIIAFCALVAALSGALPAHAVAPLTGSATVTLLAPGGVVGDSTPITTGNVDVVDVTTTGPQIAAGPGPDPGQNTNIGTHWMLPGEFISFAAATDTLTLHIAAGNVDPNNNNLVTGYLGSSGSPAEYLFTGLQATGALISGYTASFTGLSAPTNASSFIQLLSPSSVSVELDNLVFSAPAADLGQSDAYALVTINLITQAVPEPSSVVLALAGLLLVATFRRVR